jgi:hypothetical protein
MLLPLIYLFLFGASSASLFFSTRFFKGENVQKVEIKEAVLSNALIVTLSWVFSFIPYLGFPLAIASIIYFLMNYFELRIHYAISIFLLQLFVVGGLRALLGFFLVGYVGLI